MAKPSSLGKTLVGGLTGGGGEFGDKTRRKLRDPGGFKEKPKKSPKSQQELAAEKRNRSLLDKEIEESESRFKALASRRLGASSLLTGAARTTSEAAGGSRGAGGRGGPGGLSLLGGGGGGGGPRGRPSKIKSNTGPRA